MNETKNKAQEILDRYEDRLLSAGIRIDLSKKYFESNVSDRQTYHPNNITMLINVISKDVERKREKKYKRVPNRYHSLVLTVLPDDKKLIRCDLCRDWAFLLSKIERAHTGEAPQRVEYEENKVLSKIEKRVEKILKTAEEKGTQNACRDTVLDALRYMHSRKYAYKKTVLGKDRFFWDIAFTLFFAAVALFVFFAVVILCK